MESRLRLPQPNRHRIGSGQQGIHIHPVTGILRGDYSFRKDHRGPELPEGIGSQGPQGPQGVSGPVGPQGPAGPAGPTGPQGLKVLRAAEFQARPVRRQRKGPSGSRLTGAAHGPSIYQRTDAVLYQLGFYVGAAMIRSEPGKSP